jgi:hypothetical protein
MWLDHIHSRKEGIWLITFKKVERAKYISTDEVLDSLSRTDGPNALDANSMTRNP